MRRRRRDGRAAEPLAGSRTAAAALWRQAELYGLVPHGLGAPCAADAASAVQRPAEGRRAVRACVSKTRRLRESEVEAGSGGPGGRPEPDAPVDACIPSSATTSCCRIGDLGASDRAEQPALRTLATLRCGSTPLVLAAGSVLEYEGDAFVNEANEGCVGGFGLDEMVNKAGGPLLRIARQALGGCSTGDAKCTPSFAHARTASIIHAVGPVYRVNRLKLGFDETDARAAEHMRGLDHLLVAAHHAALDRAVEARARTVGFCLLSAGVFRGARALADIVSIDARALADAQRQPPYCDSFDAIHLVAYTPEEQRSRVPATERRELACHQAPTRSLRTPRPNRATGDPTS